MCVPGCAVPLCVGSVALWELIHHSQDRHIRSGCSAFHAKQSWPLQPPCGLKTEGDDHLLSFLFLGYAFMLKATCVRDTKASSVYHHTECCIYSTSQNFLQYSMLWLLAEFPNITIFELKLLMFSSFQYLK